MNISIISADYTDIREISRIHQSSFVGYFLHSFGEEFLRIYYANYLSGPEHVLLVAKAENKVIGFVAGTHDKTLLYRTLFNNNFFSIVKLTIKKFIASKKFRHQLFKRIHIVVNAIKLKFSIIKYGNEKSSEEADVKLLSIAVKNEFRGTGVSVALIRRFEKEIFKGESLSCALSVKTDNSRGIGFYKKMGWQIVSRDENSIYLKKYIDSKKEKLLLEVD